MRFDRQTPDEISKRSSPPRSANLCFPGARVPWRDDSILVTDNLGSAALTPPNVS